MSPLGVLQDSPAVRARLASFFFAAIAAVDPRQVLPRYARLEPDRFVFERHRLPGEGSASLSLPDRRAGGRLRVLAIGKAAVSSATGLRAVPGMDAAIDEGLIVTPDLRQSEAWPAAWRCLAGDHPWPGERSLSAGRAVLQFAAAARPADRHLVLLSGGASALCAAPAGDLSLADKEFALRRLMRSGASIAELNVVRKHLSALKGGRLAVALARAAEPPMTKAPGWPTLLTLALSDVAGDDPTVIGSGPTVADPSTYRQACDILQRYGLYDSVSGALRGHLEEGVAGRLAETPKSVQDLGQHTAFATLATLDDALEAVATAAVAATAGAPTVTASAGAPRVLRLGRSLYGEVTAHATEIASVLRRHRGEGPLLIVAGGEPVLRVQGDGRGGRAQELALRLAVALEGVPGLTVLVAGTDGRDGPTEAAGGFADGGTLARVRAAGCDPLAALADNDSNRALAAADDLFITGPTGTNVADLVVAWVAGR
jgi:glycerate-2-kinase